MNEINSVYIIKRDGKPLLIHQKHFQGSAEIEEVLFSRFITAFQQFISEIGKSLTSTINLGKSSIFSLRESDHSFYYILKCDLDTESESMYEYLSNIQAFFKKNYIEKDSAIQELSPMEMNKLTESILKIIQPKSNMEKFMEAL